MSAVMSGVMSAVWDLSAVIVRSNGCLSGVVRGLGAVSLAQSACAGRVAVRCLWPHTAHSCPVSPALICSEMRQLSQSSGLDNLPGLDLISGVRWMAS